MDERSVVLALCLTASGGVVIYALLLLLGVRIVRVLGLTADPPERLRYAPPPPPLRNTGDRVVATAIAARQQRLQSLYDAAFDATQALALTRGEAQMLAALTPPQTEAAAHLTALAARMEAAITPAHQRLAGLSLTSDDATLDAEHTAWTAVSTQVATLRQEADTTTANILGPPSNRTLYLLLALAVVVGLCLALTLLQRP